jgi:hypothetical protein
VFPLSCPISALLLLRVPVALLARGGIARDLLVAGHGLAGLLPGRVPITRVAVGPLGAVGGGVAIGRRITLGGGIAVSGRIAVGVARGRLVLLRAR